MSGPDAVKQRALPLAGCKATITGFTTKEERTRLPEMLREGGAVFTANLYKDCTHLLAKAPSGDKFKYAQRWGNIHIVSVAWLEDCLKTGVRQDEAKYPPMTTSRPDPSQLELLPDDLIVKIAQCLQHSPKSVFNLYTSCRSTHICGVQACISSALELDFSNPLTAVSRLERFPPACTLKKLKICHFSNSALALPSNLSHTFISGVHALSDALKSRLAHVKAIQLAGSLRLHVEPGAGAQLKLLLMELCPRLETLSLSQAESHWGLLTDLGNPYIGPGPLRLKKLQTHEPFQFPAPLFGQTDMAARVLVAFPELVSLKFGVPEGSDLSLLQLQHLRVLDLTYPDGEEMFGLHTVLAHTPLQSLSVRGSAWLGNQVLSSGTLQTIYFSSIQDNDTFFRLVTTSHLPQLRAARVDVLGLDLLDLEESELSGLLEHRPHVVPRISVLELLCFDETLLPGLLVVLGPHLASVYHLKMREPCFESAAALGDLLSLMPQLTFFESEGGSVDADCLAASLSELARMPLLLSIKLCNLTRPLPPFLPPRFIVESSPVQQLSLSGFHFMRGSIAGLSSCFTRLRFLDLEDFSHPDGKSQCEMEAHCFPLILHVGMSKV